MKTAISLTLACLSLFAALVACGSSPNGSNQGQLATLCFPNTPNAQIEGYAMGAADFISRGDFVGLGHHARTYTKCSEDVAFGIHYDTYKAALATTGRPIISEDKARADFHQGWFQ